MKRRILAVLLAITMVSPIFSFSDVEVRAENNGEYQFLKFNKELNESEHEGVIETTEVDYTIDLWHYSGGYWKSNWGDGRKVSDEEMRNFFSIPNKIDIEETDPKGMTVEWTMPLADIPEISNYVWGNGEDSIAISITNLKDDNIYYNPKDLSDPNNPQFRIEGGVIYFKAMPKFFIRDDIKFKEFISGLDNHIPIPADGYGMQLYSIYQRMASGKWGMAKGSFVADDTKIEYTDILNAQGHLKDGKNIEVYNDTGSNKLAPKDSINYPASGDIRIGDGTFKNAGAVGMRYDYPIQITFYKAKKKKDTSLTIRYWNVETNEVFYEEVKQGRTLLGNDDSDSISAHITDWDGYSYQSWNIMHPDETIEREGSDRDVSISVTPSTPNKILWVYLFYIA